jgi:hypothetical protein
MCALLIETLYSDSPPSHLNSLRQGIPAHDIPGLPNPGKHGGPAAGNRRPQLGPSQQFGERGTRPRQPVCQASSAPRGPLNLAERGRLVRNHRFGQRLAETPACMALRRVPCMNRSEMDEEFSIDRHELTSNTFCPIHDCYHDHPEIRVMLSKSLDRLGIRCCQDAFSVYPPRGIVVPPSVVNVIIQNNYYAASLALPAPVQGKMLSTDSTTTTSICFQRTTYGIVLVLADAQSYARTTAPGAVWTPQRNAYLKFQFRCVYQRLQT